MLRNTKWLPFIAIALAAGCAAETGTKDDAAGEVEAVDVPGDLGSADHGGIYHGELTYGVTEENHLTRRTPYHVWIFAGEAGDSVFIDLASREGDDTFLFLYEESADGRGWELLDYNDDCDRGDTLNSCLELELEHGRDYAVLATSYLYAAYHRRPELSYHLTVHCTSCGADEPGPGEEGGICGGIAGFTCDEGLRCDYSANESCDIADAAGVCVADEPVACIEIYAPVCGCDGVTYSNDCHRRAAGVAFDHVGECEEPGAGDGETCGGIAGIACETGLRCDYSGNDHSATGVCPADEAGVCVHIREIACTAEYDPVCGCDGVTYSNDCRRVAAYVSLAYPGPCR